MDGLTWSLVREFHEAFGLAAAGRPTTPSGDLAEVRQRLLEEEVGELADAVRSGRLDEVARELADVVYVAYGTAVTYGIDLDAVLLEVHRANMSKLGPDGRPLMRDGKVQRVMGSGRRMLLECLPGSASGMTPELGQAAAPSAR